VLLDEVRRMQAGRQILPLVGKPRSRTATSGSITVEVSDVWSPVLTLAHNVAIGVD